MSKEKIYRQSVRWADKSYDSQRKCDECGLDNCSYPVHNDYYKELTGAEYRKWQEKNNKKDDLY